MEASESHILLFEKDRGLERIMTLILKQAGFMVTRLSSIETTLDWLASREDDKESLLILDVSKDDREEERIVRQLQDNDSDLPVIVISPYGNAGIKPAGNRSIRYRILTTPFSPEELLSCVRETSKQVCETTESI